jgi:hypothetical protein
MMRAGLIAALLTATLAAGPAAAQAPTPAPAPGATAPAPATPPVGLAPGDVNSTIQDFSRTGAERRDTIVRRPKDGDTISVRLPVQGQVFINSQVPWAVTFGKESAELHIEYDVRGIAIQHTGGSVGSARATITVRLVDGRTVRINIRTANTRYKIGYAIII